MSACKPGRWIVAVAATAVVVSSSGRAHASAGEDAESVAIIVGGLVLPGGVGAQIPLAEGSAVRPVISWSLQIPIGFERLTDAKPHRIVPEVNLLLPYAGAMSVRGRLGYRYAGRDLFAGAGVGIDETGGSLSPEIGVKFAHALDKQERDWFGADVSLHLLARAEIAPDSGRVRTGTVLLGWNAF